VVGENQFLSECVGSQSTKVLAMFNAMAFSFPAIARESERDKEGGMWGEGEQRRRGREEK
jgi:hypothetical protein